MESMINSVKDININDYNYYLPVSKIALYPLSERNQSKLLVYKNGKITDALFKDFPNYISDDYVLVFNDTKVVHARLLISTETGARLEIFCLEPLSPTTELVSAFEVKHKTVWKCMVGNARKWHLPLSISVNLKEKNIDVRITKLASNEGAFDVAFEWEENCSFAELLDAIGKVPLPPYIKREAEKDDEQRYQTVFASCEGSVAAPTAGLHFSKSEFKELKNRNIPFGFITLHVGAGTFKPVSSKLIGEHYMHREQMILTPALIDFLLKYNNKKILAIGTTVARCLESIFIIGAKLLLNIENPFFVNQWDVYENKDIGEVPVQDLLITLKKYFVNNGIESKVAYTSLLIAPGYKAKIVSSLLTNFHQPKSTLLLLIASFLKDDWKKIYAHAIDNNYRFLSYGDSNLYIY